MPNVRGKLIINPAVSLSSSSTIYGANDIFIPVA